MQKYYVQSTDNSGLCQEVKVTAGKSPIAIKKTFLLNQSNPLSVGTKIKAYSHNKGREAGIDIILARTYKIQGKRYIDLMQNNPSDYFVDDFFDNLSFYDSVRLNWDFIQYLCQRKVVPALSKRSNMRLFLQYTKTR